MIRFGSQTEFGKVIMIGKAGAQTCYWTSNASGEIAVIPVEILEEAIK